jgi:hypothetical protein
MRWRDCSNSAVRARIIRFEEQTVPDCHFDDLDALLLRRFIKVDQGDAVTSWGVCICACVRASRFLPWPECCCVRLIRRVGCAIAKSGLRARIPLALLCAGHRRGQDAADGRVHQLPAPGARHQQLLRAGAQPDDLQQADRRLHAQHAQVRVQGHRRVCASNPPEIITGDNYESAGAAVDDAAGLRPRRAINIFNISKINSEVRGGKSPRIKRLRNTSARATSTTWPGCPTWCC